MKGVVLKVNSPGGGVVESADIYDGLLAIQKDKGYTALCFNGGNGCFWWILCFRAG